MNSNLLKAKLQSTTMLHRTWLAIAFLLLASVGNASTQNQPDSKSQSFQQLAQRAVAAVRAGHTSEADRLFHRAVALHPDWAEGWWFIGTTAYDAGDFANARNAFLHFVSVEKKQPGPGFGMLGLCEFQLHHYKLAREAMEHGRMLGLGDNWDFNQDVLFHDAIVYTLLGEPAVALQRLTLVASRLAAAHPKHPVDSVLNNAPLINAFGLAALRIHELPSSIHPDQAALVQQAGNAQALVALQELDQAGAAMKNIVALYPSHPGVHYMYGVYLLKANPPLAIHQFELELKVSPSSVAPRIQLAFAYLSAGKYQLGLKYAQQAITLGPNNFVAHVVCGRLWLDMGKTDKAIAQLQTAVKLAPTSPDARFALARALTAAGKNKEAAHQRAEFLRLRKLANAASKQ